MYTNIVRVAMKGKKKERKDRGREWKEG